LKFAINRPQARSASSQRRISKAPTEAAPTNTYEVIVRASDVIHTEDQTITVTVTNVEEVVAVNDIIPRPISTVSFDVPEWALLLTDTTESGPLDLTAAQCEPAASA